MNDVMKMMLNSGSIGQLGQLLGVDEKDATSAIEEVLPLLIKGMQGQASNKDTQKGFLQALEDHSKDDTSDFTKFLKNVDTEDGAKIVKHLLGSKRDEAAAKVEKKSGLDTKTILKIMAIAAPFLMSQMGKSATKKAKSSSSDDMLGVVGGLLDGVDANDVIKLVGKFLK
ncbi:MAG: DUF937 domain-containing protein [Mogibacterium sp.]|nr:DUF937 domain-containing protein [Mogibacterium sp.]